ncbi:MAG: glycosyltransferase family 4 protein [Nitrospinae bacterium]|nr:glycosyltransferase family 4 protein [Nitrospinota bacterium]
MMETGGWGGILHYSFNLAEALALAGNDVVLATNEEYELEHLPSRFRVARIFRREAYFLTIWKLARLLALEKPDILHVQSVISQRKDWLLFFFLSLARIKFIITSHNVLPHETRPMEHFTYGMMYRFAGGIILHSSSNLEEFRKTFPSLSTNKIRIIPHGHYAFFSGEDINKMRARERLGLPLEKKIVLFFGLVREYKGLDVLMESAAPILKSRKDVLFLAVGTDAEGKREKYLKLHNELGLGENFKLLFQYVPFEMVGHYFFASDLVVLPYRRIYQSGILLLAMACGVPVAATRIGAFPETMRDGATGVLVPPGDAGGLRDGILSVIDDTERLNEMGRNAKKIAREEFSWEKIAEKTLEFYNDLTARLRRNQNENEIPNVK